jgi:N-acetylmuramoyl-L-alanine amidase
MQTRQQRLLFILKVAILIFLNLCIIGFFSYRAPDSVFSEAAVPALSRRGSRGSEVTKIQQKLKNWGYYTVSVDGIYGAETEKAVRYFQRKNGLTVDGIAGPATLRAMGISSSSSSSTGGSSNSDYNMLARIISAEARGESYTGQVAVGAVVLNRIEHPSFPDTMAGVIYQPGAFSAINDGQIHQPVSETSYKAARDALKRMGPLGRRHLLLQPGQDLQPVDPQPSGDCADWKASILFLTDNRDDRS